MRQRKIIRFDAGRIANILSRESSEGESLEERINRDTSGNTETSDPALAHTAFLVARLGYEYGVASHGLWRVTFGEKEDKIIFEHGDGNVSQKEEEVIRRTTGVRLGCEDGLGDYQHFFITGKDFPQEILSASHISEPLRRLMTTRMPSLFQSILFIELYARASENMNRAGEKRFTEESAKMFVELIPILGYNARETAALLTRFSSLRIKETGGERGGGAYLVTGSGPWQWDYQRLEHRTPLFPAIMASKADLRLDPSEKGFYEGVLCRYCNVPEKPVEDILYEDNQLRNEYRDIIRLIVTHQSYESFLLDPCIIEREVMPAILQRRSLTGVSDEQRRELINLAVRNFREASEDAHTYAQVYHDASPDEIKGDAVSLFSASNRLWRGLSDNEGIVTKRIGEMIPFLIKKF